jgi:heterodisulfide reductase subunit B
MATTLTSDLAATIEELSGENVHLCYQCKKCTMGCPVAPYFDLVPHQVLRALQLGQKDLVLNSNTIWLCTQCEACATRCPHEIDLPAIMDKLKIMALHEGIQPSVRSVPLFYSAALRGINFFGRMYEAGMMGELYLRRTLAGDMDFRQLVSRDMPMAVKMIRDGKLQILPTLVRHPEGSRQVAQRTVDLNRVAYYPGCSLHGTAKDYDMSIRATMEGLGIKLDEPEGWVCCGTTPAHSTDHVLSTIMPLRSLALIERSGHSYVTVPCPSCFIRLRTAIRDVRQDGELRRQVADRAPDLAATARPGGPEPDGLQGGQSTYVPAEDMAVDHLLTTLTGRIGYDRVAQAVTRPLKGLKLVCYYGCVITRPPELTGVPDYEYPTHMERLVEKLGAEPLDWSYKTECCGVSLGFTKLSVAVELTEKVLRNAKGVGAEAVVVACPLCHVNLDARQKQIEEQFGETLGLPVFYITELMALAFGLQPQQLGLQMHFVDSIPLLGRKGIL